MQAKVNSCGDIPAGIKHKISQHYYRFQSKWAPYIFVAPFLIFFALFFLNPVIEAFHMSFYKFEGLGSAHFVGVENYINLTKDARFFRALLNSTYFAIAWLLILIPISLLLAIAINALGKRSGTFFQVLYYSPSVVSLVVVAIVFRMIYDRSFGFANLVLSWIGISPLAWLEQPNLALLSIILLSAWRYIGVDALYFLAGLRSLPSEIFESAAIDGANRFQTFMYITVPLLRPITIFVIVITVISSYQLFTEPFLLTGGGPGDATLTPALYLYQRGFSFLDLGYAASMGLVLGGIIFILSFVQRKLLKEE
ncbi:MAG TPA: sugar ABC transporter permease [Candidatus Atribacteria bacterium]|nr:sugar ABC transporter permease [Candidatus Atribacteria bacterium]